MKKILLLLSFLFVFSVASAQDILQNAIILNSPNDLGSWPVTANITNVHFDQLPDDTYVAVDFDRRVGPNRWPDYPWGSPGDSLQYSLGICLNISGWKCSAPLQFWYGRDIHATTNLSNWFYDSRWDGLTGYHPANGEQVGIFVIAGNGRGTSTVTSVRERSNVSLVLWNQNSSIPAIIPPPVIIPAPVIPPVIQTPQATPILDAIQKLSDKVEAIDVKFTAYEQNPPWLTSFFKDHWKDIALIVGTALTTCKTAGKC